MMKRSMKTFGLMMMISLRVVTSSISSEFSKEEAEIVQLETEKSHSFSDGLNDEELLDLNLNLNGDAVRDLEDRSFTSGGDTSLNDSLSMWPYYSDHKNKTHEDTSCWTHKSCAECYTHSGFCHWCSHDNSCHARGSIHGCFSGTSCTNNTQPKENSTCAAHTNCMDCTDSSSMCHWCAHDNSCHMVGSVYGCMTGVDCYSNDRCLRQQPEYVDGYFYEDIGMLPILLIFATGILCCCFASLAFCCVAGVKGAYVNLVDAAVSTAQTREPDAQTQQSFLSENLVQAIEQQEQPNVELVRTEAVNIIEETDIDDTEPVAEQAALLATNPSQEGYSLIVDRSSRITITSMVSPRPSAYAVSHSRRSGMGRMYCLYNLCRFCYVITLIGIGFFLFGSIRYYPKIPLYNVCNDAVAWKSIVDSMTNFKVEANFEILVSVLNNNNLDLAVDKGQGSFKHNGEFVGTFEIPPTVADSMAITDILVVATFTPEKWEALSLSKEYYAGTLSFDLDAEATFRVPALLDFTYNAAFENIHVMVNDPKLDDKHLCKCQK